MSLDDTREVYLIREATIEEALRVCLEKCIVLEISRMPLTPIQSSIALRLRRLSPSKISIRTRDRPERWNGRGLLSKWITSISRWPTSAETFGPNCSFWCSSSISYPPFTLSLRNSRSNLWPMVCVSLARSQAKGRQSPPRRRRTHFILKYDDESYLMITGWINK